MRFVVKYVGFRIMCLDAFTYSNGVTVFLRLCSSPIDKHMWGNDWIFDGMGLHDYVSRSHHMRSGYLFNAVCAPGFRRVFVGNC